MVKYKVNNRSKLPSLKEKYDPRSKWDWTLIRTEYIEGAEDNTGTVVYPDPKDLVEKYEIPSQALRNRINSERWKDHRLAHQNALAVTRQKEQAKFLAGKAVKFDEQAADGASEAQQLILNRLRQAIDQQSWDMERTAKLQEQLENGSLTLTESVRKEMRPIVTGSELESLGKAFALFNEVGRKALGIKDDMPAIQSQTLVQINTQNNNASEEMQKNVEERNKALAKFFTNPNVRIPGLTDIKALEANTEPATDIGEESIEEAEVIE